MVYTKHIKNPRKYRQQSRYKFFKMRVMPDLISKTINKVLKDSVNPKLNIGTYAPPNIVVLMRLIRNIIPK